MFSLTGSQHNHDCDEDENENEDGKEAMACTQ